MKRTLKILTGCSTIWIPDHFDRFTYLMAEAVVRKVELANELTKKLGETVCGETEQNYGDRLRDVQIWCKERLYRRQ